jgi:hypothetical protein
MPRKISITGKVTDTKKIDGLAKARAAKAKKAIQRNKEEEQKKERYMLWLKKEKIAYEKMVNDRSNVSLAAEWKHLWEICPI